MSGGGTGPRRVLPRFRRARHSIIARPQKTKCLSPAGTIITAEMVEPPKESVLWTLRREMEEAFSLR